MIARTTSADMSSIKVSFCVLVGLRNALQSGLRRHGVGPRRFHYEEFEFRTGSGLKRLTECVMARIGDVAARRKV